MDNDQNTEIRVLKDGPIEVKGEFVFKDSSGQTTKEHKELYLCRCGGSANKPFCDDNHKKIGVRN